MMNATLPPMLADPLHRRLHHLRHALPRTLWFRLVLGLGLVPGGRGRQQASLR